MSSELKVNSIRDTSNNEALTISSGNVSFNNTLTQPDALYCHGNVASATQLPGGGEMLNLTGSTNPYISWTGQVNSFGNGSGNVSGSTDHDFKFLTKGVYFINFSLTIAYGGSNKVRQFVASIRGNGSASENTTVLSSSRDQLADTNSSQDDYGNTNTSYVGLFNANDQINFHCQSYTSDDAFIIDGTHVSLFLIKAIT